MKRLDEPLRSENRRELTLKILEHYSQQKRGCFGKLYEKDEFERVMELVKEFDSNMLWVGINLAILNEFDSAGFN
jgi:hypothetical protein